MSFSDVFSTLIKIWRVLAIVSIVAGAGYKVAPTVWHKAEAISTAEAEVKTAGAAIESKPAIKADAKPALACTGTNSVGFKISACDLGAISLTNHCETCVPLGTNRDCILTPKMINGHSVQLTLAVESKTAAGKIRDLTVARVVAQPGKPLQVALGGLTFSLTPNLASE